MQDQCNKEDQGSDQELGRHPDQGIGADNHHTFKDGQLGVDTDHHHTLKDRRRKTGASCSLISMYSTTAIDKTRQKCLRPCSGCDLRALQHMRGKNGMVMDTWNVGFMVTSASSNSM
eukprot:2270907-Amphidinium_carterae.1